MNKINIKLPDGSIKQLEKGATVKDVAYSIGERLGKAAVAGKVNGKLVDVQSEITEDADLEIVTLKSDEGTDILRHSTAHIMAEAVKRLFPDAKYAIGPSIKDGFYYDFDVKKSFTPEDLEAIEKEMDKIIKEDNSFVCEKLPIEKAIDYFKERDDKYKVEILEELKDKQGEKYVTTYTQGGFTDLCRGPHIPSTGYVKAFKLMSIAGAYWRGDSDREQLSRIYGTAFADKKSLKVYLKRLEEAKKRDHRKLGKELDLFSFHDEAPGMAFWHHKGKVLFNLLLEFMREENAKRRYQEIMTPYIMIEDMWHKSGHYENYKENMYFTEIDKRGFAVKPMNCPGHLLVYNTNLHSYRELPIKIAEFGYVHRHELSGVLHGLLRVRGFTQDDAHIFCTEEQLIEQVKEIVECTLFVYKSLGFEEYTLYVATKPEKAIGSDEVWEKATKVLIDALDDLGLDYLMKEGEGAFYGPKIEFNIKDCLDRNWQCGTAQIDFSMPDRFDITYEGSDSKAHKPVMIHRAILGSLDRFIGILIEHYEGKFPLWLSPVQVKVIPVSDAFNDYAEEVYAKIFEKGYRVETDLRSEKLGYKIRNAQLEKVPYMIVVGEKEQEEGIISLRSREKGDLGQMSFEELVKKFEKEIKNKE